MIFIFLSRGLAADCAIHVDTTKRKASANRLPDILKLLFGLSRGVSSTSLSHSVSQGSKSSTSELGTGSRNCGGSYSCSRTSKAKPPDCCSIPCKYSVVK